MFVFTSNTVTCNTRLLRYKGYKYSLCFPYSIFVGLKFFKRSFKNIYIYLFIYLLRDVRVGDWRDLQKLPMTIKIKSKH